VTNAATASSGDALVVDRAQTSHQGWTRTPREEAQFTRTFGEGIADEERLPREAHVVRGLGSRLEADADSIVVVSPARLGLLDGDRLDAPVSDTRECVEENLLLLRRRTDDLGRELSRRNAHDGRLDTG
jgi:hypothetical protein